MLDYARAVVREMSIDDEEFRVGFLTYSNGAYRQFYLNDRMTKADVIKGIDSVSNLGFGNNCILYATINQQLKQRVSIKS